MILYCVALHYSILYDIMYHSMHYANGLGEALEELEVLEEALGVRVQHL